MKSLGYPEAINIIMKYCDNVDNHVENLILGYLEDKDSDYMLSGGK